MLDETPASVATTIHRELDAAVKVGYAAAAAASFPPDRFWRDRVSSTWNVVPRPGVSTVGKPREDACLSTQPS